MSAVAPGTRCEPCHTRNHFCAAVIDDGGVALCFACDAGHPCAYVKTVETKGIVAKEAIDARPAAALPTVKVEPTQVEDAAADLPNVTRRIGTYCARPTGYKATQKLEALRLLEAGISQSEVQARTGLSKNTLYNLRAEMLKKTGKDPYRAANAAIPEDIKVEIVASPEATPAIAKRMGIGYSTVAKIRADHRRANPGSIQEEAPMAVHPLVYPEVTEDALASDTAVIHTSAVLESPAATSPYDAVIADIGDKIDRLAEIRDALLVLRGAR